MNQTDIKKLQEAIAKTQANEQINQTSQFVQNGLKQTPIRYTKEDAMLVDLMHNNRIYKKRFPTYAALSWDELGIDPDYGRSRFDKRVQNLYQLQNLNDFRASEQSGFGQITNGFIQIIPRAIGSGGQLLNLLGFGLLGHQIRMAATKDPDKKAELKQRYDGSYLNNEFSNFLNSLNDWASKFAPIYRTDEKRSDYNLLHSVQSSGWWGESFISNLGFTIGSLGASKLLTKGLNKAGQKFITKELAKLAQSKGFNAVDDFLVRYRNSTVDEITNALNKINKLNNRTSAVNAAIGLVSGSMSEAQFEALENYKNFLGEHKMHLKEYWNPNNTEAQIEYNIAKAAGETNLSLNEYCEQQYNKHLDMAAPYAKSIMRHTFAWESILLSVTNSLAWKNWYLSSFRHNKLLFDRIKPNINYKVSPQTGLITEMDVNKGAKRFINNALQYIKPFAAEGFEEQGQAGISEGLRQFFGSRLNQDYIQNKLPYNYEYEQRVLTGLEGISRGLQHLISPSSINEGFVGGLTGILGMPASKMTKAQRKAENISLFNPKAWKMSGGIWEAYRDIRDTKSLTKKIVEEFRKNVKGDTQLHELVQHLAMLHAQDDVQTFATIVNDKKQFLDSKREELITLFQIYDLIGMRDDFLEIFDTMINSENNEELKNEFKKMIRENYASNTIDESDPQNKKDLSEDEIEEIYQSCLKHNKKNKESLQEYSKIYKDVVNALHYYIDVNDESNRKFVNLIANQLHQAKNLEIRNKEIEQDDIIKPLYQQFLTEYHKRKFDREQIQNDSSLSKQDKEDKLKNLPILKLSKFLEETFPNLLHYGVNYDSFEEYLLNEIDTITNLFDTLQSENYGVLDNGIVPTTEQYQKSAYLLRDWYLNSKNIETLTKHNIDYLTGIISPEDVKNNLNHYNNEIARSEHKKKYERFKNDLKNINFDQLPSTNSDEYKKLMNHFDSLLQELEDDDNTQAWNEILTDAFKKGEGHSSKNPNWKNPALKFFVQHYQSDKRIRYHIKKMIMKYQAGNQTDKVQKLLDLLDKDIHNMANYLNDQIENTVNQSDQQDWKDIQSKLYEIFRNAYLLPEQIANKIKNTTRFSETKTVQNSQDSIIEETDYEIPMTSVTHNTFENIEINSQLFKQLQESYKKIVEGIQKDAEDFQCELQNNQLIFLCNRPNNQKTGVIYDFNKNLVTFLVQEQQKTLQYDFCKITDIIQISEEDSNEKIQIGAKLLYKLIASMEDYINKLDWNDQLTWEMASLVNAIMFDKVRNFNIPDVKQMANMIFGSRTNRYMPFIISNDQLIKPFRGLYKDNPETNVVIDTFKQIIKQYQDQLQEQPEQTETSNVETVNEIPGLDFKYSNTAIQKLEEFKKQFPINKSCDFSSLRTALQSLNYTTNVNSFNSADELQHWAKELGYWITFSDKDNAVIDNITFYEQQDGKPYSLTGLANVKHGWEINQKINVQSKDQELEFQIKSLINQTGKIAYASTDDKKYSLKAECNGNVTKLFIKANDTRTGEHQVKDSENKSKRSIVGISQYDKKKKSGISVTNEKGEVYEEWSREANNLENSILTEESRKWKKNPLFYTMLKNLFNSKNGSQKFSVYEYFATGEFKKDYDLKPNRLIHFKIKPISDSIGVDKMYKDSLSDEIWNKIKAQPHFVIEAYWTIDNVEQTVGFLDPYDNSYLIEKILKAEDNKEETTTFSGEILDSYESVIFLNKNDKNENTIPLNQAYRTEDDKFTPSNGKRPQLVMLIGDKLYTNTSFSPTQEQIIKSKLDEKQKGVIYLIPYNSNRNQKDKDIVLISMVSPSFNQMTDEAKQNLFPSLYKFTDKENWNTEDKFNDLCKQIGIALKHLFVTTKGHHVKNGEITNVTPDNSRFIIIGDFQQNNLTIALRVTNDDGKTWHAVQGQNNEFLQNYELHIDIENKDGNEIINQINEWLQQVDPLLNIDKEIFSNENANSLDNHVIENGNVTLKGLISNDLLHTPTKHIYMCNATALLSNDVVEKKDKGKTTEEEAKSGNGTSQSSRAKRKPKNKKGVINKRQQKLFDRNLTIKPEIMQGSFIKIGENIYPALVKFTQGVNHNTIVTFEKDDAICMAINTGKLQVVQETFLPLLGLAINYHKNDHKPINFSSLFGIKNSKKYGSQIVEYSNDKTQTVLMLAKEYAEAHNVNIQINQSQLNQPQNPQSNNASVQPTTDTNEQPVSPTNPSDTQGGSIQEQTDPDTNESDTLTPEQIKEIKNDIISEIHKLLDELNNGEWTTNNPNHEDKTRISDSLGSETNFTMEQLFNSSTENALSILQDNLSYLTDDRIVELFSKLNDPNQKFDKVC